MSVALYLIFFLSGASALVFETIWFRLAGLAFGNSVWASSLVLSAFMAGLGGGNLLAARYGPALKRPLLVYAGAEVTIGVAGYSLVLAFPLLTPLLAAWFAPLLETPELLQPLRFFLAFLLLLIPSTAMGVTLPVLVKTLSSRDVNFGRVLGRLYGWNTLGAVAGALAGELFLIGRLGIHGTAVAAATLNVVAASASVLLAQRERATGATLSDRDSITFRSWRQSRVARLGAATFLSGSALLALEVVWFRFLLLFVFGTSLVFAVMLSVILLGIGAGGLVASWWLGRRPTDYRHAALLALSAAVVTAFTYIAFDDGFGFYNAATFKPVPDRGLVFLMTAGLCLPTSLFSGMLFTFLGRALRDETGDETFASATLTFSNTLGAAIGAFVAGFVLIPLLGVEGSFFVLGLTYLGVALLGLAAGARDRARSPQEKLLFRVVGAGAVLLFVFFPFGLMRNHYIPMTVATYRMDGSQLVAVAEGQTETAVVLRADILDRPRYYRLVTNGYSMSSTTPTGHRYMRLFAYWPAVLHPSPKKALLISYGVGLTAKALTEIERLESIDVVDISENILELSRRMLFPDRHPLEDPRVRVHIEDGRFLLQTTRQRYDIITGEPPPPQLAGIVNLYSKEYFALLHDRLAPGGFATYWLPVNQLGLWETKAIIKAFCAAFDDCTLWSGAAMDWMLAGSRSASGAVPEESFTAAWRDPHLGKSLRLIGVEKPEQLGALFLADKPFLDTWTKGTEPLEDDHPKRIASYPQNMKPDFSKDLHVYEEVMRVEAAQERFYASDWIRKFWPARLRESTREYFPYQRWLNRRYRGNIITFTDIQEVLETTTLRALPILLLNTNDYELEIAEQASTRLVHPDVYYLLACRELANRDYPKALQHLDNALRLDPANIHLAEYRVLALVLAGEIEAAQAAAAQIRGRAPADGGVPGFWEWLSGVAASPGTTTGPVDPQIP